MNDETTFTCPTCRRTMPSLNSFIHSARCTGSPPVSTMPTTELQQHTVDVPVPPSVSERSGGIEIEDFWVCRLCSYHNNRTTTSRCVMCDTPFDQEEGRNQNAGWSCQLCTYDNPNSSSECVMCSNSRPSDQVYSERLIDEPDWCRILNESGERQSPPTQNCNVSVNTTVARGAVLGALGGAALAYMNNRSVSQGAIGGAALGALFSLSPSNEPNTHDSENHNRMGGQNGEVHRSSTMTTNTNGSRTVYTTVYRQSASPFHSRSRRVDNMDGASSIFDEMERMLASVHQQNGGSVGFDGTDGLSYEDLLERFGNGNVQRSATEETINSLPTRTFTDPQRTSSTSSEEGRTCLICLEQFSEGTCVKTLPCLHQFCSGCVDTWLRQNSSCPICKTAL